MVKKFFLLIALVLFMSTNAQAAAEQAAAENDIDFDPIATTYTEGDSASLTLIRMKTNGAFYFVAADTSANIMSVVQYSRKLYDFYLNKTEANDYPPLIFIMALPMSQRGQLDDNLGEWEEKTVHVMPVYAMFNVENGQVICDKQFYSATSMKSTHFQEPIKNPHHTRLVEILMTHMPRLHKSLDDKGINLP